MEKCENEIKTPQEKCDVLDICGVRYYPLIKFLEEREKFQFLQEKEIEERRKLANKLWKDYDYEASTISSSRADVKLGYTLGVEDGYNQAMKDASEYIRTHPLGQSKPEHTYKDGCYFPSEYLASNIEGD